jgi:nucleoside-diphosphate-sugar epimerase
VINIGHPEVIQTTDLAEMMCRELRAPARLLQLRELPEQMTLVKRPNLERQSSILGFLPEVPLSRGITWVCAHQAELARSETDPLEFAG